MGLHALERVVDAPPDRPERAPEEYLPMQDLTRRIALEREWTAEVADRMRQLFDGLAPEWHLLGGETRLATTRDALARGGVPAGGTCLEVGSGIGLHTPPMAAHFGAVVSVEIAPEMLARAARDVSLLVQADASQLPLRSESVDAVVCVNAFLFPDEYERVLSKEGVVVFVSTSGDRTPIYLAPEHVLEALPGHWDGATAEASWGTWTVARRQGVAA